MPDTAPAAEADTRMCTCSHHWNLHYASGQTGDPAICRGLHGNATPGPYWPCDCRGFEPWSGPTDARTGEPVHPITLATDSRAPARERLADRSQMVGEVKGELDDAFQFTERDGSRHSYVTRAWVESLLSLHAASAAAAERARCVQVARDVKAAYPVTLDPSQGHLSGLETAFPFGDFLEDLP
jgi:hypothetical protein